MVNVGVDAITCRDGGVERAADVEHLWRRQIRAVNGRRAGDHGIR
jgi:hypothetical protein